MRLGKHKMMSSRIKMKNFNKKLKSYKDKKKKTNYKLSNQ